MGNVEIDSIELDESKQAMEVAVSKETLAQAIGRSGQNVRLCSQITGWQLNVVDKDLTNQEQESQPKASLMEYLDVDEDLASVLVKEGFSTLELISSCSQKELSNIEGFDEEIADLIINRSKKALLTLAMEISSDTEDDSEDLMAVEGVDMTLALELNQKGIKTRDDLAEQSIDELIEIIKMDKKKAGDLILKAREHWFNDD
tara:strand:- start:31 stop:636 length:606 start_codon:yes stop_codon:yes gene_type:complete